MTVTPIYAALIAGLYIALSARVITYRRQNRISLGPGDDPVLLQRVRAHANCAEYAPFALLLLTLCELQEAPVWMLHGLGLMALAGRLAHAYGLSRTPQDFRGRVSGMILTFTQIGLASALTLILALV